MPDSRHQHEAAETGASDRAYHDGDHGAPPDTEGSRTRFSTSGSIPPVVQTGDVHHPQQSASELAYEPRPKVPKLANSPRPKPPMNASEAADILEAAADVLANKRRSGMSGLSSRDSQALDSLLLASTGHRGYDSLDGKSRASLFDQAMAVLAPAIAAYDAGPEGRDWIADYVQQPLDNLRHQLVYLVEQDRVKSSFLVDGKVIDPDDSSKPHEQAALLHTALPKLVSTVKSVNETVLRIDELSHGTRLEEEVERQIAGHFHGRSHLGSLLDIANVLAFLDGGLLLTDDELRKKMEEGSPAGKVGTMSELVKASVEVAAGAIEVTASVIAFIGKISGENDLVQLAGGLARGVALKVGYVITAIEVLHGGLAIVDPQASIGEKVDGSVDVVSGMLWLTRKLPRMGWGGPASIAIQVGYEFAKYALKENWNSSLGLETGLMQPALEVLQRDAITIALQADELVKARALASTEPDPSRKAALERVEQNSAAQLSGDIDHLVTDLQPPELGADMTRSPGRYQILRDAMAPVLSLAGTKTPDAALSAAQIAIERVKWTLQHAPKIIEAQTIGRGLEDVEEKDIIRKDTA